MTLRGHSKKSFKATGINGRNKILEVIITAQKISKISGNEFMYVKFNEVKFLQNFDVIPNFDNL